MKVKVERYDLLHIYNRLHSLNIRIEIKDEYLLFYQDSIYRLSISIDHCYMISSYNLKDIPNTELQDLAFALAKIYYYYNR